MSNENSVNLALQGGGVLGAFTWGVLDALLENGWQPNMVSGASAGAINAVLLADGWAEAGGEGARKKLGLFWNSLGSALTLNGIQLSGMSALLRIGAQTSPYQSNPLGFNLLKHSLQEHVNFARLQKVRPLALRISATRVDDATLHIFREDEISVEHVLASCCLPHIHHAVEIDGIAYWDGGFSANPPLVSLFKELATQGGKEQRLLLIEVMPQILQETPRTNAAITKRMAEIAFLSPLLKEKQELSGLLAYHPNINFDCIRAEDSMPDLHAIDPMLPERANIMHLHDCGCLAAQHWIAMQSSKTTTFEECVRL